MVTNISILRGSTLSTCVFERADHKVAFSLPETDDAFSIQITFDQPIIVIRTHDYKWTRIDHSQVSAAFVPKILRLQNNRLVQANRNIGIWEIDAKQPSVLYWRFNDKDAAPLTSYTGISNSKLISAANQNPDFRQLSLLFPIGEGIEFSRSKIPFSAIACFTDHCDFDTSESLKLQRELFKDAGIRVTKGFFRNHFSKRDGNASFEHDADELSKWRGDGHELAYHSLSQSIKNVAESLSDFENFDPPFPDLPTWIDHGYQPYNLSLFENNAIPAADYEWILTSKNIKNLWNYIDTGTAASGIVNQLNPQDFTLARFVAGNVSGGFVARFGRLIKNIVFHFYADEKLILSYKGIADGFKKLVYQKKPREIITVFRHFLSLAGPLLKVLLNWQNVKNQPYRFAKFSPLYFRHKISKHTFYVFQTIEMTDFTKSLSAENLQKLIAESGIFIAHTYFSAPMSYHSGRLFQTPDIVDASVRKNFEQLGMLVSSQKIWNPTLKELLQFLSEFENSILDVADGKIVIAENREIPYRNVH